MTATFRLLTLPASLAFGYLGLRWGLHVQAQAWTQVEALLAGLGGG